MLHALHLALGVQRDLDHAAARLALDFETLQLLLHVLHLGLHGLRLLHQAHDVHGCGLLGTSNVVGGVDAGSA